MALALSRYQHGVPDFTPAELTAITAYEQTVHTSELRESFDLFGTTGGFNIRDNGMDAIAHGMFRDHATAIGKWSTALDTLLADLLTCTTGTTEYSPAARKFIKAVTDDYHRTRQRFEYAVTVWALDLNPRRPGHDEYPAPTHSVDFLLQTLVGE